MNRGSWQATVHNIAKSQIQLIERVRVHTHTHTHTHTLAEQQGSRARQRLLPLIASLCKGPWKGMSAANLLHHCVRATGMACKEKTLGLYSNPNCFCSKVSWSNKWQILMAESRGDGSAFRAGKSKERKNLYSGWPDRRFWPSQLLLMSTVIFLLLVRAFFWPSVSYPPGEPSQAPSHSECWWLGAWRAPDSLCAWGLWFRFVSSTSQNTFIFTIETLGHLVLKLHASSQDFVAKDLNS